MNSVRDAVHPVFDPDAAQSVVQRAGAVAQIELRVQRVGQVSLGPGDSFFQRKPFGKVGRNGTGQSAARTVGVGVGDTLTRKPDLRAIREGEQIVGVGVTVAALEQDGTAAVGGDVTVEKDGETSVIQGEKVLLSVGRHPVTKGFGLETLAPEPFRNGIKVNGFMQTSVPNVYACGDITAFSLLAHTAVSEAEVAVDHILGKNRSMSYKAIPGVVYTNPEIAGVGKTEEELQAEGTPYTVKKIPMAFSGRFVAENEQGNGVCKLILAEDETIIGAHLLGNPASELIVIAGIAVEKGMKASELKSIVFPHPTVGEILKEAL